VYVGGLTTESQMTTLGISIRGQYIEDFLLLPEEDGVDINSSLQFEKI
jgi:hypothetical protein